MKNTIIASVLLICLILNTDSFGQIDLKKVKLPTTKKTAGSIGLSEAEIAEGLKAALSKGAETASKQLNKSDGYNLNPKVRIPFPEDAQRVAVKLRELGYGKKVDDFEVSLNRSAEHAAREASVIFVNAIKQMSISDAKNILTGADTAATGFLRKSTYGSLNTAFTPHIKHALDSTNATTLWTELATIYNKIPFNKQKANTDLVAFTTGKALKGVFVMVAEEELKIRKDPAARTSDILKKVFGQ
jgi:hypothetical protein